ncbi:germination protein YpeB [Pseudalkalibacillus hwajinpoensis]|uniref:Germination protein YpeB n=1 Tax=Guptibacillus hwajinpoensis TaxID=208199 RepID=A0A4U1MHS1_9BACL|nr:germination protein YpeB [Pseudalkalibacillus hwajinpoensis]TKD69870.1 germination protein YpeB [Pseudalkalibacillus hwajinpoensis]
MIRSILIGALAIGVVGTGYWGYKEHQEKNAVLINAENTYQRAFHDLNFHMDALEEKIGSTLAMNSRSSLSPALAEVWRLTSEAQNDVGQLPLTLMPFNKTEEFLSNIGSFSYRVAVRDLDERPLSNEEYETLKKLHNHSNDVKNELRKVQAMVIDHNLRWMDVELALASESEPQDNTIIDGFKTVDKQVEGYSEVNWGPEINQLNEKKENLYKNIKGKELSEKEAKKRVMDFLDIDKNASVDITTTGKESKYQAYSLSIENPDKKSSVNLDVTKKGAKPIWILMDRKIGKQKLSLNEAANKATSFLKEHDITNMEISQSSQYDKMGVFTFISQQGDVSIYPDAVHIKVALDNGDITGYESLEYLTNHHERKVTEPTITRDEALEKVNPNVQIMEEGLGIIKNDLGDEVLCYEFMGTIEEETYRIFVNADNGREERVEKMDGTEMNYNTM